MSDFLDKLPLFDPIFLKEMGTVKLMNRTDTKYLLNINQLGKVLDAAKGDYKILEIKKQRISIILKFFLSSNTPKDKKKVRMD